MEIPIRKIFFEHRSILAERVISKFLDELTGNIFTKLGLEFSNTPTIQYDAKLEKLGVNYKCVSMFGEDRDSIIWLPPPIFKALTNNNNSKTIYITIVASISDVI